MYAWVIGRQVVRVVLLLTALCAGALWVGSAEMVRTLPDVALCADASTDASTDTSANTLCYLGMEPDGITLEGAQHTLDTTPGLSFSSLATLSDGRFVLTGQRADYRYRAVLFTAAEQLTEINVTALQPSLTVGEWFRLVGSPCAVQSGASGKYVVLSYPRFAASVYVYGARVSPTLPVDTIFLLSDQATLRRFRCGETFSGHIPSDWHGFRRYPVLKASTA